MQKLLIVFYALWQNAVNNICFHTAKQTNRVLIIFQQIFGDSVIFSSAIQGYSDYFVKDKGMSVTFLCRPSIAKFLSAVAPIPDTIDVETIDYFKLVNNFSYFKEISNYYRRYADIIVVPGTSASAELLSSTLIAKQRVGLVGSVRRKWPLHLVLFQKLAYTNIVLSDFDAMIIQNHRKLLGYLGKKDFKGKLPILKKQVRIIEGDYCVVCPSSSMSMKCWPIDRFAVVCDWIIENYGWSIHLCGGNGEEEVAARLIGMSVHRERIVSHVGSTSFADWSSIIEYAQIVVGNDSATLHIAAGHRVKAVCIVGVWEKLQYYPYKVDELNEGDRLPVIVQKDFPCASCRTKGYYAGYGNKECRKAISLGSCSMCIEGIKTDEVIRAIEKLLE